MKTETTREKAERYLNNRFLEMETAENRINFDRFMGAVNAYFTVGIIEEKEVDFLFYAASKIAFNYNYTDEKGRA